jgi:hypothetical protein
MGLNLMRGASIRGLMAAACALLMMPALAAQSALKIVVIAGEDGINVIQQNTAVAPIVEVRDRNDQPVAGAVVTFTLGNTRNATLQGGARTVSTVTDRAGRTTTALTPGREGRFDIQVRATHQGRTATARISQTNVATTAQASALQAAAAGGAAAGAGGGLSGVVIGGVVAGGAVGGVVAARELTREDSGDLPLPRTLTATYSVAGTLVAARAGLPNCSIPYTESGSLQITLETLTNGAYSGTATLTETDNIPLTTCVFSSNEFFTLTATSVSRTFTGTISGPDTQLSFTASLPIADGRIDVTFVGAMDGEAIAGTYTRLYARSFVTTQTQNQPLTNNWRVDLTVPLALR